ncbi:MAG: hypothetical protein ACKOCZ_00840 [Betaproteobacteria bacterium]
MSLQMHGTSPAATDRRRPVVAVLLACALGSAAASGLSPEERLEALRHGLVQQAVQGATQVQSTAWIDTQGVLRESSSFRTGMQVRGVRVIAYARDEQGHPQARVQVDSAQDLVKTSNAPQACPVKDKLRHVLGLQVEVLGRSTLEEAHLLRDARAVLGQAWQDAALAAVRWQTVELAPPGAQSGRGSAGLYERLLTGGSASSPALSWQLMVSLEPIAAAPMSRWMPWAQTRPVRARLQLALQGPGEKTPALQRSAELSFEARPDQWSAPRLNAASRTALRDLVQGWAQAVTERLACESVQAQVLQAGSDRLQIDQGALAGVQAGDEWLVSDRRRWPVRMLEKEAAASLVLARVERVSDHQAQLRVLAGSAGSIRPQWQAWPVQAP